MTAKFIVRDLQPVRVSEIADTYKLTHRDTYEMCDVVLDDGSMVTDLFVEDLLTEQEAYEKAIGLINYNISTLESKLLNLNNMKLKISQGE